jgi:hypothetical protein
MPRNERRNAHRYAPARNKIRLGWWEGQQFHTISARLMSLSLSGSLVQLDKGAAGPARLRAWFCLVDQSPTHWIEAETIEVCPELAETPCMLRLKFLDAFPYESFKMAVWDVGIAERKPGPGADETPPGTGEATAQETNKVNVTERERLRSFLQLEAPTAAASTHEPDSAAQASPHPPTLLEAYRRQMVTSSKVASLPWLMIFFLGLFVSILLGILAKGQMIILRKLGIVLGLTDSS